MKRIISLIIVIILIAISMPLLTSASHATGFDPAIDDAADTLIGMHINNVPVNTEGYLWTPLSIILIVMGFGLIISALLYEFFGDTSRLGKHLTKHR